jgi:hypothetical protein
MERVRFDRKGRGKLTQFLICANREREADGLYFWSASPTFCRTTAKSFLARLPDNASDVEMLQAIAITKRPAVPRMRILFVLRNYFAEDNSPKS